MKRVAKTVVVGMMAAAVVGLTSGPAGADPTRFGVLALNCDNGHNYTVAIPGQGNGSFTPALAVNSTAVLMPIAFGAFTGTVTDAGGNVVDSFTEEPTTKGRSRIPAHTTQLTCSYTFSETFTQDGATFTFTGTGSAIGFATAHN